MEEKELKIGEIGEKIGYIVGKHCNDEEVAIFEKFLEEHKKLLQAYKQDEKVIEEMAKEICFKEPLRYNNAEEVIDYFRKKCE